MLSIIFFYLIIVLIRLYSNNIILSIIDEEIESKIYYLKDLKKFFSYNKFKDWDDLAFYIYINLV